MTTKARDAVFASFEEQFTEFGPIRLRQYNDLLGGEIEEYDRQQRESAQLMLQVSEIARTIGEHPDSGMDADQAFALLSSPQTDAALKISVAMKWGPPGGFGGVAALLPAKEEQHTRMITLAVLSRGSAQVDGEWLPLREGWSDADSRALPGKLRTAIINFMVQEGKGGPQPAEAGEAGGAGGGKPQGAPESKPSTNK
jgi:hypothetical protein